MNFESIFNQVWRHNDLTAPGFAFVDLKLGSSELRNLMVRLKDEFNKLASQPFQIFNETRFNQQITTKFHLDGGPEESILVLGYEPSVLVSQIHIADHCRAAHDLGISPEEYLEKYNPMFPNGEAVLQAYIVELPPVADGMSRILLINNSPKKGVLHQATVTPAPKHQRIINSLLLATSGETISDSQLHDFLTSYIHDPSQYDDESCSLEEANRRADAVDELYFGTNKKKLQK